MSRPVPSRRGVVFVLAILTAVTAASCSSDGNSRVASSTTANTTTTASPAPAALCPVSYTGPNPTREQVEADISALATEQNALYDKYRDVLGDRAPGPTDGRLTDQQAAVLAAAPGGALERLSATLCSTPALASGMADRVRTAVAAAVPDGTPNAETIRADIASVSARHPISVLLGTTFDICTAAVVNSALTRETNPLANDQGAIAIVTAFCPAAAGLFAPPA